MRRLILPLLLVSPLALAACAPSVPDSGAGVGFNDYNTYEAQREAALNGGGPVVLPGAQPIVGGGVTAQPVGGVIGAAPQAMPPVPAPAAGGFSTERLGAAIDRATGQPMTPAPMAATGLAPAPMGSPAVGAPMATVAGSAAMAPAPMAPAAMAPAAMPQAPATPAVTPARTSNGPNIVEYALRSTNAVGTPVYSRSALQLRNPEKACAAFASADLAQTAFLEAGGPDRDRKGLDPDGDGFACTWDPSPFRRAVQ